MAALAELSTRIDAEFIAAEQKIKAFQQEQVAGYRQRQERIVQLEGIFEQLREIWRPRLDVLAKKFGERVQIKPEIVPLRREATFTLRTPIASVQLKFSASADGDVTKVILGYDLQIIPVLMQFEKHAELVQPLDAVDTGAVERWVDDRILSFIKTYVAMHENKYYLKDQLVTDPITNVQFPKFVAAATVERGGRTYYFVSDETRQEFEKQGLVRS